MKNLLAIAIAALCFTCPLLAFADCERDGQTYPTGARVGPFTCTADGSWKR
jgi:hypothetical protein